MAELFLRETNRFQEEASRQTLLAREITLNAASQACYRDLDGRDVDNFPVAEVHPGLVQQPSDRHLQHRRLE